MCHYVSHITHFAPRDCGIEWLDFIRYVCGCFTNNHEVVKYGLDNHLILPKFFKGHLLCELLDILDGLQNICDSWFPISRGHGSHPWVLVPLNVLLMIFPLFIKYYFELTFYIYICYFFNSFYFIYNKIKSFFVDAFHNVPFNFFNIII